MLPWLKRYQQSVDYKIIPKILFIYLIIYLPAFLDTGLPRGNVHERDSGPMQGAMATPPGSTTSTLFE